MNDSDHAFIRRTNRKLERRSRLNEKKEKGSPALQHNDPSRKTEVKRFLKSKKKELESPEAQLFLNFLATWPLADVTLLACEMTWGFIQWLKKAGYHIIDERTVFCIPFSHLVKKADLK